MVILPPPAGEPTVDRILFWCRKEGGPGCPGSAPGGCSPNDSGQPVYGRAYVKELGKRLVELAPPADIDTVYGSQSMFCGGQTQLEDGSLIVVGGTDRVQQCVNNSCVFSGGACFAGSDLVVRLDTSVNPPVWGLVADNAQLTQPFWYCSAITLDDGSVFVAGHDCDPMVVARLRQLLTYNANLTVPAITLAVESFNEVVDSACQDPALVQEVHDYPRLHLLKTGDIMDPLESTLDLNLTVPVTRFFDRDLEWCSGSLGRWIDLSPAGETSQLRFGGNTVHFITRNPADEQETIEVIYAIGGGLEHDEANCDGDFDTSASVERMVEPDPNAGWVPVASLNYDRMNHNSTILLDGSIFVASGESDATGQCLTVTVPERLKTQEVFHNGGPVWQPLATQTIGRAYHSVQGLLRDGRVVVAGGTGGIGPTGPGHTLAYYSPPYMFQPRPEIKAAPSVVSYGSTFPVLVELTGPVGSGSAPDRVALIRAGSSTHAWDSGQRYVELFFEPQGGPYTDFQLDVHIEPVSPGPGGFMLPPGFYILTVVDKADRPSVGHWLLVE